METTRRLVRVRISGRVQGVGYRAWSVARAQQSKLVGYVRNCANGDVEAVFAGEAASVAAMVSACWDGPRMAQVVAVDVEDLGAGAAEYAALRDFTVRPTR